MTIQILETVLLADIAEADKNVRRTATVGKEFLASIKQHGILQPPVGWRDSAGVVHITMGQRRTLAARKLGLESIPVIIAGSQEDAEATRIVAQLAENDHRDALPDADHVEAFRQLSFDLGLSAAEISKRTNMPRARVQKAVEVAESSKASDAMAAYNLTIDEAAVFLEFQDDPESVKKLVDVLEGAPSSFAHTVQRLRDQRAERVERAVLEAHAADLGIEVFHEYDSNMVPLDALWRIGDAKQIRLVEADMGEFTGWKARIGYVHNGGDRVRELGFYMAQKDATVQGLTSNYHAAVKPPATEEEKAAKKAAREQTALMRSATTVRREWLGGFLANWHASAKDKKILASVTRLVAATVLNAGFGYSSPDKKAFDLAATLLGYEAPKSDQWSSDSPGRLAIVERLDKDEPIRLALAAAIANYERNADDAGYFTVAKLTPAYLAQLSEWGYTLSDVEQTIVNKATK